MKILRRTRTELKVKSKKCRGKKSFKWENILQWKRISENQGKKNKNAVGVKKNSGGKNQDEEKIMVEDAINTGEPKFRWKKIEVEKKLLNYFQDDKEFQE